MSEKPGDEETEGRISAAGWVALVVLAGFLGWTGWYAVHTWTALSGVEMSIMGWIFLSLGIVVTILVGAGLMALLFYSSRNNYDQ